MATVVLQYAGQAVGTFLGGPVGGIIGRAVGAVAGNIIDQALFGSGRRRVEGPRLSDLRIMSSTEGAPVPRLWGRMRISGQVIWATHFEEVATTRTEKASAKGGGGETRITEYSYLASFAVALCEGEIDRIGRVWADGKPFDIGEVTARIYLGSETQAPDSLIVAKEGADHAPAYRGIAYVVFERLPVGPFGNRLPQLSFEVFRSAGGAQDHVRAVNIIPGASEFGYDTMIVTREPEPGVTEVENAHATASASDWTVSIDQLQATCRNLAAASLVVTWFGNDLRCGSCTIRPGVETADKITDPEPWSVNGAGRAEAHVVSRSGGSPAFGGTPSDASVIRAIHDLKARGLTTVFYPFVMMDVPAGNGLPDPYGGTEQAAYPWRGRITASLAPGLPGSPDGTASATTEIAAFAGSATAADFPVAGQTIGYAGPAEWSYRRMVLHYAHLCALAGGVDAFLIGSELRGLTTLRGPSGSFPFVDALVQLAAEVKTILPHARVSYAADWSEYFGYHPADGSGDVFFHLDPLWASPHVDFVGIDNYMPLADWRDGRQHADHLAGWRSIHDPAYLMANIAGGEGFDWYYADPVDRQNQIRSPISDGAHGKHWVFRYKDLAGWWGNVHVNRVAGVETGPPTAWVPQSKPVWFTEAGCPAVDKGANQPNVFVDPKSSENALPHFSRGHRDDLIQASYITALGRYWMETGPHNPVSGLYGAPMVDAQRIFLWAWDARPYPWFPALSEVWADGANYQRGHWLNGRLGAVPLGALITAVCAAYGFTAVDAGGVEGLIDGFVIDRPMSARDALEDLLAAHAVDVVESGGLLRFSMRKYAARLDVDLGVLVETQADAPLFSITRAQETELPATIRLGYMESERDYHPAALEARHVGGSSLRDVSLALSCAVARAQAKTLVDMALQEAWAARELGRFALPPSLLRLEPGDVVDLAADTGLFAFHISEVSDATGRTVSGRSHDAAVFEAPAAPSRIPSAAGATVYGRPDALVMALPIARDGVAAHAPWMSASARPWPGGLAVHRRVGPASFAFNRTLDRRATQGRLLEPLAAGPLRVFDRANSLTVKLMAGALAAVSDADLLQGANVAAVGSDATGWEIIQFADAELVGTRTYRLSRLLRGQSGSAPEMRPERAAGERFVLLNRAVVQPVLPIEEARLEITWRIGPASYDIGRSHVSISHAGQMLGLRPLAPCHLRAVRDGSGVTFRWIRQTRLGGDSWEAAEVPLAEETESYRVEVLDGGTVIRAATVGVPAFTYANAAIAADFGADPGAFTLRIAQLSAVFGAGAILQRTVDV